MVFVKVRETYDLHTIQNKMTVIGIHTPSPNIIKSNYPGLLMQCKMYRPYSCDVKIACASVLPLDPLGVGTAEGDVAPEDVFNPILYKAMSNVGMSQLEARINYLCSSVLTPGDVDLQGSSATVDVDSLTNYEDEFNVYYGLLSTSHGWKKANPQSGLEMRDLVPIVHEIAYNIGDNGAITNSSPSNPGVPDTDSSALLNGLPHKAVLGGTKRLPFLNCTSYTGTGSGNSAAPGFNNDPYNNSQTVPYVNCVVAGLVIPPSRRHELFYRMVVEWTLEFTSIRPIAEITSWVGLNNIGQAQHYQNYNFEAAKNASVGSEVPDVLTSDAGMVSANVDVNKVM